MIDPSERVFELQEAADTVGVHYQTAYRWVRSGRLPAQLVGGKYLVAAGDLEQVREQRDRPVPPAAPSRARLERQRGRMHEALADGDEFEARKIARRLVDDGLPLVELIDAVIVPPLRAIGQAWHDGDLTIWAEHRASAIVDRVLGDLLPNPRGRRRGTAMVAAVEGDLHSLPTTMAAVALRECNWHVHHLGANMPADQLVEFCAIHDVDVAVISVTNMDVQHLAERVAAVLCDAETPTIVGGTGRTLHELLDEAQRTLDSSAA